jgi:hypothetical protein
MSLWCSATVCGWLQPASGVHARLPLCAPHRPPRPSHTLPVAAALGAPAALRRPLVGPGRPRAVAGHQRIAYRHHPLVAAAATAGRHVVLADHTRCVCRGACVLCCKVCDGSVVACQLRRLPCGTGACVPASEAPAIGAERMCAQLSPTARRPHPPNTRVFDTRARHPHTPHTPQASR